MENPASEKCSFKQFSVSSFFFFSFEEISEATVNTTWRGRHVNFSGTLDDLKTKQLLLQTIFWKIYFELTRFH